jgi:hypothetical protein
MNPVDKVVYDEIPTDVDSCYQCGLFIDHDCIEVSRDDGDELYNVYLHLDCYPEMDLNYFKRCLKVHVTKYVLNADDK